MVTIDNPTILMTRGDTLAALVKCKQPDGTYYTPQSGDSVRFALKTQRMNIKRTEFVDSEPILEKDIDIGTMVLGIDPADTAGLGFGRYVYDIELTYANGKVDTFIADAEFWILPEVGNNAGT